jgi:hypothetical protein
MRYYCVGCDTEIIPGIDAALYVTCFCGTYLTKLPDFETPEQYEKRTGKKWNGAVWWRFKRNNGRWSKWQAHIEMMLVAIGINELQFLCANSPELPPDDYIPEGV